MSASTWHHHLLLFGTFLVRLLLFGTQLRCVVFNRCNTLAAFHSNLFRFQCCSKVFQAVGLDTQLVDLWKHVSLFLSPSLKHDLPLQVCYRKIWWII